MEDNLDGNLPEEKIKKTVMEEAEQDIATNDTIQKKEMEKGEKCTEEDILDTSVESNLKNKDTKLFEKELEQKQNITDNVESTQPTKNSLDNSSLDVGGNNHIGDVNILGKDFEFKPRENFKLTFDDYDLSAFSETAYIEELWDKENFGNIINENIFMIYSYDGYIVDQANNFLLSYLSEKNNYNIKFVDVNIKESFDFAFLVKNTYELSKCIVLVDIRDRSFYDSIFKIGIVIFKQLIRNLKKQGIFILLSLTYQENTRIIENIYEKDKDDLPFFTWEIDFIIPLFKRKLKNNFDKHINYQKLLLEQRSEGLWEASNKYFYLELKSALIYSSQFIERIQRDVKDIKKDAEGNLKKIEDVFDEDDLLESICLILSQFNNLNHKQLDELVVLYLEYLVKTNPIKKEIIEKDGVKVIVKHPSLVDRWNKEKRKKKALFRKLSLETRVQENGKGFIDFENAFIRKRLKEHFDFNEQYQLEELWIVFKKSNILFNDDIDSNVIEGIVQLLDKLVCNFGNIGENYIQEIYRNIIEHRIKISFNGSNDRDFIQLIESHINKTELLAIEYKFSRILVYFYEKDALRKTVDLFTNSLIENDYSRLFIKILDSLKYVESFDELIWIKKMLNNGSYKNKQDIFSYLLYWVNSSSNNTQVLERCTKVNNWIQVLHKNSNEHLSIIALSHPILQLFDIVKRMPVSNYSYWSKDYPLFLFIMENDSIKQSPVFDFFVNQLFNQELDLFFFKIIQFWKIEKEIKVSEKSILPITIDYFRSQIIQHWFLFLVKDIKWNGKSKTASNEMNELLNNIKEISIVTQRDKIIKYLSIFRNMNIVNFHEHNEKKQSARTEEKYKDYTKKIKINKTVEKVLKYLCKNLK